MLLQVMWPGGRIPTRLRWFSSWLNKRIVKITQLLKIRYYQNELGEILRALWNHTCFTNICRSTVQVFITQHRYDLPCWPWQNSRIMWTYGSGKTLPGGAPSPAGEKLRVSSSKNSSFFKDFLLSSFFGTLCSILGVPYRLLTTYVVCIRWPSLSQG